MAFIRDHFIRPSGLVVECGSHHGFTTVLLSKWVSSGGKVVAFEANPRNASIAIKNLEINRIKNVEFHVEAVGSQTGKIWITDESNAQVAASFGRGVLEVPIVRLDDLFADHIPDLIKIDVEGYEVEVIRGLRSTLAKKATKLAVEVHCNALKNYGSSTLELFETIGLEDYDCWFGTGDEAKAGIKPFIIGQDEVPLLWRIYLFAVPKGTAFLAR
jgi:FkbM family methyltransferase